MAGISKTIMPLPQEQNRSQAAFESEDSRWVLGSNSKVRQIAEHAIRASDHQCTVLISGETGTGKEVWAQYIHQSGPRSQKPFLPINCSALTVTLAESQLFGHEKGAFTGAAGSSLGIFRAAEGGVVFLDEVGEMPLELQPKLLRVLQEQEVTPVGSSHPVKIDVQIIAATNRNLEKEVAAGRFREDLYYRLNLVDLSVPPLRERPEDIPEFVRFYASRFAKQYNHPTWTPDAKTLNRLCEYHWPGNIRQLSHVIEQSYVLSCAPSLPGEAATEEDSLRLPCLNLRKLRDEAVRQALLRANGRKGRAAQLLGVHANTMTRLLKQVGENLSSDVLSGGVAASRFGRDLNGRDLNGSDLDGVV
jgi:DNA-binding NtrC family response regulator